MPPDPTPPLTPEELREIRKDCSTYECPILSLGTSPAIMARYTAKCQQERRLKETLLRCLDEIERLNAVCQCSPQGLTWEDVTPDKNAPDLPGGPMFSGGRRLVNDPNFPGIVHEPRCSLDRTICGGCFHDPETGKRVDPPKTARLK